MLQSKHLKTIQENVSITDIIGTSKECLLYRGLRYLEFLPKLAYFASETCFSVLGYSTIEIKVCQKVGVGRRESGKMIYWRMSWLYNNLKATGLRVFLMRERANQQIGQESCLCGSH